MKLKKIIILLLAVSLVAIGAPKAKAGGIGTGAAIGLGVGALFLGYSMGAAQPRVITVCAPRPTAWVQCSYCGQQFPWYGCGIPMQPPCGCGAPYRWWR